MEYEIASVSVIGSSKHHALLRLCVSLFRFALEKMGLMFSASILPTNRTLQIEIDGEYWGECGIYQNEQNGCWYGCDEVTKADDKVRGFRLNKSAPLFHVGVFKINADKSISGITGEYRHGEWATYKGAPLYRVWDRVA